MRAKFHEVRKIIDGLMKYFVSSQMATPDSRHQVFHYQVEKLPNIWIQFGWIFSILAHGKTLDVSKDLLTSPLWRQPFLYQ